MMMTEKYIRQAEGFAAVSEEVPGEEFLNFYERYRDLIGKLTLYVITTGNMR